MYLLHHLPVFLHHPSIHLLMYLLSTPPIHQSDIQKIQKCHSPDVAECCGGAAVWRTRWRERPPPPLAPTAGPRRGPLPPLPDKGPQRRVRNRENGAGPLAPSLGRQRYDVFLFHRLGNGSLGTRWRFDGKLQKNWTVYYYNLFVLFLPLWDCYAEYDARYTLKLFQKGWFILIKAGLIWLRLVYID